MLGPLEILIGILTLAILMIVHEGGHFLAARSFGMRVTTFSIGFGPTFFKVEPSDGYFWFTSFGGKVRLRLGKHDPDKHGPTVYQVAMIPFLAYVQIAGMNPFEDQDPQDKGSYANASLFGRITTIFAGPLANYLFASVFFFFAIYHGGVAQDGDKPGTTVISVTTGRELPAEKAGMKDGDRIVVVNGKDVDTWEAMAKEISQHPEKEIEIVVMRGEERIPLKVTPKKLERAPERGIIGVALNAPNKMVSTGTAIKLAVEKPPLIVRDSLLALWDAVTTGDAEFAGPKTIVEEGAKAANRGVSDWLNFLGVLSAYLGAFNLVPFPALDGGRLVFLGYELATRRRPNAQMEAQIHLVGLLMLLSLMVWVTVVKGR